MELFFDTETSGLPLFKEDYDHPGQPHVIQIGWVLSNSAKIFSEGCLLVRPDYGIEWEIHPKAEEVHGYSKAIIEECGIDASVVVQLFQDLMLSANQMVAHNFSFDQMLMRSLFKRSGAVAIQFGMPNYCTMLKSTNLCKLPGKFGYKWPKLEELYQHLFDEPFEGAHDALADVRATRRCYYAMRELGV